MSSLAFTFERMSPSTGGAPLLSDNDGSGVSLLAQLIRHGEAGEKRNQPERGPKTDRREFQWEMRREGLISVPSSQR